MFAVLAGLVVLLTVLAVAVEVVTRMPLPEHGSFAVIARTFMPAPAAFMGQTEKQREEAVGVQMLPAMQSFVKTLLHEQLPAMVEHRPFVILAVYALDLLLLTTIALRRWRTTCGTCGCGGRPT
ncbi:MAG: hypothetical protein U0871_22645 [Gemmataceae bacterium]